MADDPLDRFPDGLTSPQQWLDALLPRTPNVAPDFIKHELLSTLRDFCRESACWREWIAVPLEEGVSRYTLVPPVVGTEVQFVYEGQLTRLDGTETQAARLSASPQPLAGPPAVWASQAGMNGQPTRFWQRFPGEVDLAPVPTETEISWTARFFVSLVPTDLIVPDWLKAEFFDPVADGVLARVYLAPGPCQDKELALFHRKLYVAGRTRAKDRARKGYSDASFRLRFPYFAAGSRGRAWA